MTDIFSCGMWSLNSGWTAKFLKNFVLRVYLYFVFLIRIFFQSPIWVQLDLDKIITLECGESYADMLHYFESRMEDWKKSGNAAVTSLLLNSSSTAPAQQQQYRGYKSQRELTRISQFTFRIRTAIKSASEQVDRRFEFNFLQSVNWCVTR